ncbi:MAG: DUF6585 family protein [Anaerolineales bacterium]
MPPRAKSLGPQVAEYRSRPFSRRSYQAGLVIGALAILAPLAYGFYRAQYAASKYGPVAAQYWSRPWYLLAGAALAFFLVLLGLGLAGAQRYVGVYKNGLRLRLSRRKQYTWGELSGVATGAIQTNLLGIPLRTRYQAVLYPTVSSPVRLDNSLEGLPELLTRLKANLYPRLLPGMRKAFQDGKTVYFGPVAIQGDALLLEQKDGKNRQVSWSQVQSLSVQAGMLVIAIKGESSFRLPVARVPNLELLLQIIQSGVTA